MDKDRAALLTVEKEFLEDEVNGVNARISEETQDWALRHYLGKLDTVDAFVKEAIAKHKQGKQATREDVTGPVAEPGK